MNDFVLTHAVAWHHARRAFINEDKKICRLPFPNWQMAIKKGSCHPNILTFSRSQQKKFKNQTKTGRLAAISNFCLILFISSKNSFCKTVCFLGPNPKFNFMRSLQFFQRSQQKRLSNSTVLEVCCRQNPNSTDVYLHFENPKTNEILAYDDPVLARYVTSESSANNIKYSVSGGLSVQASDIHPPYEVEFIVQMVQFVAFEKSAVWFYLFNNP